MPVQNYWLIENRIIVTELIGSVTIEELVENATAGTIMIEGGVAPVYSLVDLSRMEGFPTRLNEFKTLFRQPSSSKLRWIIICGIPNSFASFIATTFAQIVRKNYKVTPTRADALKLIEKLEGQPLTEAE